MKTTTMSAPSSTQKVLVGSKQQTRDLDKIQRIMNHQFAVPHFRSMSFGSGSDFSGITNGRVDPPAAGRSLRSAPLSSSSVKQSRRRSVCAATETLALPHSREFRRANTTDGNYPPHRPRRSPKKSSSVHPSKSESSRRPTKLEPPSNSPSTPMTTITTTPKTRVRRNAVIHRFVSSNDLPPPPLYCDSGKEQTAVDPPAFSCRNAPKYASQVSESTAPTNNHRRPPEFVCDANSTRSSMSSLSGLSSICNGLHESSRDAFNEEDEHDFDFEHYDQFNAETMPAPLTITHASLRHEFHRRSKSVGHPDYTLGQEAKERDMIHETTSESARCAIAMLRQFDMAFVKRTNGKWTYAMLIEIIRPESENDEDDCNEWALRFVVDETGATKLIKTYDNFGHYVKLIKEPIVVNVQFLDELKATYGMTRKQVKLLARQARCVPAPVETVEDMNRIPFWNNTAANMIVIAD